MLLERALHGPGHASGGQPRWRQSARGSQSRASPSTPVSRRSASRGTRVVSGRIDDRRLQALGAVHRHDPHLAAPALVEIALDLAAAASSQRRKPCSERPVRRVDTAALAPATRRSGPRPRGPAARAGRARPPSGPSASAKKSNGVDEIGARQPVRDSRAWAAANSHIARMARAAPSPERAAALPCQSRRAAPRRGRSAALVSSARQVRSSSGSSRKRASAIRSLTASCSVSIRRSTPATRLPRASARAPAHRRTRCAAAPAPCTSPAAAARPRAARCSRPIRLVRDAVGNQRGRGARAARQARRRAALRIGRVDLGVGALTSGHSSTRPALVRRGWAAWVSPPGSTTPRRRLGIGEHRDRPASSTGAGRAERDVELDRHEVPRGRTALSSANHARMSLEACADRRPGS